MHESVQKLLAYIYYIILKDIKIFKILALNLDASK